MANIFQKLGSAFGQFGMDNRMPTDQFLNLAKGDRRKMQVEGLQKFSEAMNLIGAQQSGNAQKVALAQNTIRQRQLDEEDAKRKAEQDQLIASMSPEQQKIYKTFGPNAAFNYQQQQLAAEAAALEEIRTKQGLEKGGFSEEEINLFLNADMKAKDIIELRDVDSDQIKSLEELNTEIDNQYVPSKGLQVIDRAFGLGDTIGDAFNKTVGPIFGTPVKETNTAINARGILNESLRERFVNQYSGRPSVYLNQRIDTLLPMGTYNSEFDAMQKYQEIKRVLDQGKAELQENINSGMFEGTELLTLQNEYKSTSYLIRDLDTVIGNLSNDPVTLEPPKDLDSSGKYNPYFINKGNDF